MKFIILVSNLKEISPSVFSWKKNNKKNYDAIPGADPWFYVKGDESRLGVCGPLKVSSEFRAELW